MAKKRIDYNLAKMASTNAALTEQFTESVSVSENNINELLLSELIPNPYQPRIHMDKVQLKELAMSIEKEGLLQPILVTADGNNYIILAGHRRVEAHKILNKDYIKAVILDKVAHERLAIIPIIENLQRDDMDPIENAIAFKRLLKEGIIKTQIELAEKIAVSKQWMSKMLSILKLPNSLLEEIQKDKYKDINVLTELNKIDENKVEDVYKKIKSLTRQEAIIYIKSIDNQKQILKKKRVQIGKTSVMINMKNLEKNKKIKLELLIKEIQKLID